MIDWLISEIRPLSPMFEAQPAATVMSVAVSVEPPNTIDSEVIRWPTESGPTVTLFVIGSSRMMEPPPRPILEQSQSMVEILSTTAPCDMWHGEVQQNTTELVVSCSLTRESARPNGLSRSVSLVDKLLNKLHEQQHSNVCLK